MITLLDQHGHSLKDSNSNGCVCVYRRYCLHYFSDQRSSNLVMVKQERKVYEESLWDVSKYQSRS